ncbi:MAG: hypothetical protein KKA81_11445 [Bacteroidetes bacterium]|nr:hypothetical protein [Bacteroidota bacterium]
MRYIAISIVLAFLATVVFVSCSSSRKSGIDPEENFVLSTLPDSTGRPVEITFRKGPSFNYPLLAIWVEDMDSNYIATLYIAESIGKGTFQRAQASQGKWQPGEARRPAALPYWAHKRGVQEADGLYLPTPENPVPDAITGPTPTGNFTLKSFIPDRNDDQIRILLEINQSWDWNEFWTNNKYLNDKEYMSSSQPAVVYEAIIDPAYMQDEYIMKPIGHSHYSGKDGKLYRDLETLTSALEISAVIKIRFPEEQ